MYHEEGGEEEVIQEEGIELSLSRLEEEMAIEDDGEDSDDDAPVYLDLSEIKQGKDEEVSSQSACRGCLGVVGVASVYFTLRL